MVLLDFFELFFGDEKNKEDQLYGTVVLDKNTLDPKGVIPAPENCQQIFKEVGPKLYANETSVFTLEIDRDNFSEVKLPSYKEPKIEYSKPNPGSEPISIKDWVKEKMNGE